MMLSRLAPLVRLPDLRRQLALYVLARLPSGMLILALLLHANDRLRTLSGVGGVLAAYSITVAVAAPAVGRLADRIGARRVLPVAALTHLVGIAVVIAAHSAVGLGVGAVVAGAGLPPTAACLRALWRDLPTDLRPTVFAVDGIVLEAAQVVGPLVVSLLTAAANPATALAAAASCTVLAALLTAATVPHETARPAARRWLGPLRSPAVDSLLLVLVLVCAAIAIIELSVVSDASDHHHPAVAGLLFAAMAGGSAVGGVVFAARDVRRDARTLLAPLCLGSAAGFALLLAVGSQTWLLFVVLAVSNAAISPIFAAIFDSLSDAAPPGETTETFTWVSSGNFAAISGGTALGGLLITHSGLTLAYLASVGLLLLAAGVGIVARALTRSPNTV